MGAVRLDEDNLPVYLKKLGLVAHAESVEVQFAGDGNINWVYDYEEGKRRSQVTGKPMFVVFRCER